MNPRRFFAVWVILLAMGVFSSFISSITSTVSSLRTYRLEQSKKQSQLLRFFNERTGGRHKSESESSLVFFCIPLL